MTTVERYAFKKKKKLDIFFVNTGKRPWTNLILTLHGGHSSQQLFNDSHVCWWHGNYDNKCRLAVCRIDWLQRSIGNVSNWTEWLNLIKINSEKSVSLDQQIIAQCDSEKYLGMPLDSRLNWKNRKKTANYVENAAAVLAGLYRVRHSDDQTWHANASRTLW